MMHSTDYDGTTAATPSNANITVGTDDSLQQQPKVPVHSPTRRSVPSHIIETTSQMHTLDYHHPTIKHDEYYYDDIEYQNYRYKNNNDQQQHDNKTSSNESNQNMNDTNNHATTKRSWFSNVWNNQQKQNVLSTKHSTIPSAPTTTDQKQLSLLETKHDTDMLHDNSTIIIPGSPKRRPKLYQPIGQQQQQQQQQQQIFHNQPILQHGTTSNNVDKSGHDFTPLADTDNIHHMGSDKALTQNINDTNYECSFFFRPLEGNEMIVNNSNVTNRLSINTNNSNHHVHEQPSNNNNTTTPTSSSAGIWKSMRRDNHKHFGSMIYEYTDAVPVTPIPILQRYRTRFAQLNHEIIHPHITSSSSIQPNHNHNNTNLHHSRHTRQEQYYLQQYMNKMKNMTSSYNHHDILEQQRDPFDEYHLEQSSLQLQEYDTKNNVNHFNYHDENTLHMISNHDDGQSYYHVKESILPGILPSSSSSITIRDRHHHQNHMIVRSDTIRQSSLFFRVDGRIVMRLPRDNVRLLVDPDLEVGILSVEQWRIIHTDHTNNTTTSNDAMKDIEITRQNEKSDSTQTDISKKPLQIQEKGIKSQVMQRHETIDGIVSIPTTTTNLPELRYVLTVSDDIYRKIVEEMSPTTTKYFCCNRACCNDEEKMDIRIAYILFGTMLLILFVNMLAFREN